MSLTSEARGKIQKIAPLLHSMTEVQIEAQIRSPASAFRNALRIATEGRFEAFYAPLDWLNDSAKVVIVGVTPGLKQATEAFVTLHRSLLAGKSVDEAAQVAKEAASFKGTMRTLGARLMDHFGLNSVFGIPTCLDLFGTYRTMAHYTSVVRYPITKDGENYSGDERLMKRPLLRKMVDEYLPVELEAFPRAWVVPFGPCANAVVDQMVARGILQQDRVLGGILHPSGTQWNRYKVQLGLTPESEACEVSGGLEVLRRSNALRRKVAAILDLRT